MTVKGRNGRSAIEDLYPLTPLQQGLWFHEILDPASRTYFQQNVLRIDGSLDRDAFRRAWEAVVARHAVLRTRIVWEDLEQPLQLVQPEVELPWVEEDWRDSPVDENQTRLRNFLDADRVRGLDLTQAPLMRLTLLQVTDTSTIFVWSFLHVILDRWSIDVLLKEVWSAYEALAQGRPLQLGPLRPYRDYLAWLKDQDLNRAEQYWRQLLSGFTAPTALGVGQAPITGAGHQEDSYGTEQVSLSEAATSALSQWARQHQVTVNTVVQGAWGLLLSRYSATEDVVFGATVSGRSAGLPRIESMVGLFINTLPVRVHVCPGYSLTRWFAELQEQNVTLREYEYTPLYEIQKWSEIPAGEPLFNTLFVFENIPLESGGNLIPETTGLNAQPVAGSRGGETNYPLSVVVVPGRRLQARFTYDTEHFSAEAISRMAGHFQQLLAGIVGGTEQQPLGTIPLLTEAERRQLRDWSATATAYPRDATLAARFEAQAAATPDAVGLVFENQQLTYRELNDRADQLARYLQQHYGVGPEVRVGLYLPRSVEMIVGVLGIIKAGGAYVPLDPNAPPGRLAFILGDADVTLVLSRDDDRGELPAEWSGPVIALDSEWSTIAGTPATPLTYDATAENLAYIMYTSGSTGVPKGTSICQRSVLRLVMNTNYLEFGPEETYLQFGPLAFDASTLEIWGSLLHGSKLVVYPPHQASLEELARCLQEQEISTLWLTAAIFHQMVDSHPEALRGVRQLLSGGEVLSVPHVQRALAHLPDDGVLINGYGPTENTTFTCCHVMTRESRVEGTVPIGRPIANTQVYVLDRALQPVPVGVYGELYIGGDGLARDYVQRPALTAEKFVPDPFSEVPGARLYCTGDLVRYRPDGTIEFQGRRDHQVKLRGFRIELGEIESVLGRHPAVRTCVALVREDEPGDKRLVGYVVPAQASVSVSDLRRYLREQVPDYMVPAHFVMLDALPVTPNGKVDRRALPAPEGVRPELDAAYQAPQGPIEEALARIWTEVLRIDQVGRHDNFFDLGGHSLLAAKIATRLRTSFAVDMPLRVFFDAPTIAGLSDALAAARRGEEPSEKIGITPVARDGALPLSFAQERFWFLDQIHAERDAFNAPAGFRISGPLQVDTFRRSVQALVDRHETLRTTFPSVDGEPHQVIAASLAADMPLQDCPGLSAAERAAKIRQTLYEEKRFQFDLGHGPLFRTRLLRFAEDDHCLILSLHHIINDAWSLEVIIKDLVAAYTIGGTDRDATLPELPIQYVDYSHWQREFVEGSACKEQLEYWKHQLAQLPPALPLPTDYARPSVQTFRGGREKLHFPAELIASLRSLNRQEGTTLFMILLAALQLLLSRLTGTHDILVGFPIAGRDREELQDLIGCFLNTLVLRTDLSGKPTGRELLKRVREIVLDAYENQDVPFEKILAEVQPVRDTGRTPIFQVLLNMHSFDDHSIPLPALSVTRENAPGDRSLFDMTLYFAESAEKIAASLAYNADLFAPERMKEFMRQLQYILEQMVNDPDQPLEAISLVTPSAQSFLPDPGVSLAAPRQPAVHDLIARWALDTPDCAAVRQGQQQWSYRDLASQAENAGRTLAANGMRQGTVVALSGAPSFGLIVGMLGVLQSGGVLLMVDPVLPGARKSLMLEEAHARILIVLEGEDTEVSWAPGNVRRVTVSPHSVHVESGGAPVTLVDQPESGITEGDPAYIFFTSGTTGKPKGIIGSHQSLSHFLTWQRDAFGITPADRAAQLTGLSFDVVLRDIFLPLISGGVLCLPDEADRLDGERILRWLDREGITILHTVPAVASSWLATVPADVSLSTLRWAFFAGEPLTDQLVRAWRDEFPESGNQVNLYGPTETTLAKCFYQVPDDPPHGVQPIGRPLPDTQVLIMNSGQRLCGVGEVGEIVIRTPFRTLGPLPAQGPASSFFQNNPYRPETQSDLYFSGDLGRYGPDGTVEILGRVDEQVKIRGVRIEPNEVMSTVSTHPSVHACFVMAREDNTGLPALVAYVVPTANASATASELRAFVTRQLPPAMVPSSFVFLEDFPYTPNGKIDRKALPLPDAAREQVSVEFVAPETPTEKQLAKIWEDLLGLERVGIEDNFFELGGHSLLATQVISRVRRHFAVDLPLLRLFETPTIAGLTELIETIRLADRGPRSHPAATTDEREAGEL